MRTQLVGNKNKKTKRQRLLMFIPCQKSRVKNINIHEMILKKRGLVKKNSTMRRQVDEPLQKKGTVRVNVQVMEGAWRGGGRGVVVVMMEEAV